ncbi:MAG: BTAD domain-containing putative transcriptional regulator, partial [Acidimicrobiales bacterium]|nr:BTAD domain-containing putative transcriptional regulator [Acidimicrobiales bacterium]
MHYRVLGPLEIVGDDDRPLALGGPRPRALVALLLAAEGQSLAIDVVADELWAGAPPPSAAATLHTYVSRLRRVLPADVLLSERGSYALVPDGPVDRDEFVRHVASGRAALVVGNHDAATRDFAAALAHWRGDAFPELTDSDRGRTVVAALDELRRSTEEDAFEAALSCGRHQEVTPDLEAAVIAEPMRERRWGQLMVALYRSGRQADALARYQALRARLADELGLDPGPELSRLEQQILTQDPTLDAPGLPAAPRSARSLPAPVTSFVGRAFESPELAAAVRANRLVTVTGPGGVGKSRLALELVRAHHAHEPDDLVAFAELAGVTDATLVAAVVAAALGIDETGGGPLEVVLRATIDDGRGALVVLDNCEHLVDSVAGLVDRLLTDVPDLRVVATSREPLGVLGEAVWRVEPMPVEDAVRLFQERAGQAVTSDDDAVRAVCQRLDGLPLAIELAAARLRSMSLEQLLGGLDDRFGLLGAGPRSAPERQRSLHALVGWSHDLLEPDDQGLFAALSVFAGSFDAPAAEAVAGLAAGSSVSRLADLVDKSLVVLHPGNRYRMLETIRQFAAEQLDRSGRAVQARNSHLQWFRDFAASMATELRGPGQLEAMRRCDAEQDNVRAAIEWAVAQPERAALALDITVGVWRNWLVRGQLTEGRQLLAAALAAAPDASPTRAWALLRAGALAECHGDVDDAIAHDTAAIDLARQLGVVDVEALALNELANARRATGDLDAALTAAQDAVAVARTGSVDPLTRYICTLNLANTLLRDGRQRDARALYEEALPIVRASGDEFGLGTVLSNLGVTAFQAGDYDAALGYTNEGAAIAERLENKSGLAMTLDMRAQIELARGNRDVAASSSRDAVALLREIGNSFVLSIALGTAASVKLVGGGDPQPEID